MKTLLTAIAALTLATNVQAAGVTGEDIHAHPKAVKFVERALECSAYFRLASAGFIPNNPQRTRLKYEAEARAERLLALAGVAAVRYGVSLRTSVAAQSRHIDRMFREMGSYKNFDLLVMRYGPKCQRMSRKPLSWMSR